MTPSGMQTTTFWLAAQCFDQLRHCVTVLMMLIVYFGMLYTNVKAGSSVIVYVRSRVGRIYEEGQQ